MSRLIWFYAVCKNLLLSPVAVKELNVCRKKKYTGVHMQTADLDKFAQSNQGFRHSLTKYLKLNTNRVCGRSYIKKR